ncbi:MAG: sarcosine oxidase subunit gamma [Paracoccaceae bacterium]
MADPIADLYAKTPCAGLLPVRVANLTVTEVEMGVMTTLSLFHGTEATAYKALEDGHGLRWPAPLTTGQGDGARILWFGRGQALLAGVTPDECLAAHMAVADQSDAWAAVHLTGDQADDILARLVPIDLRETVFPVGSTARTQLMHMQASITREASDRFLILVFRSMAATLVHDLKSAMEAVAARG